MFDKDISILRDVARSFVCSEADVHVARIWLVPYGSAKRAMEVKSCRHLGPSKDPLQLLLSHHEDFSNLAKYAWKLGA
jgi:hypothetical protein